MSQEIDPKRPCYFQVGRSNRGRRHRIDFSWAAVEASHDVGEVLETAKEEVRRFAGTHYVFEVRAIRKVTRHGVQEMKP